MKGGREGRRMEEKKGWKKKERIKGWNEVKEGGSKGINEKKVLKEGTKGEKMNEGEKGGKGRKEEREREKRKKRQ